MDKEKLMAEVRVEARVGVRVEVQPAAEVEVGGVGVEVGVEDNHPDSLKKSHCHYIQYHRKTRSEVEEQEVVW